MPCLYLIRHGITAANLEKRFAGRSDEPLHPDGVAQIKAVADRLRDKRIHRIITGPLARTRQTGTIIGEALGLPVSTDDRLTEILLPHWDGLTKAAIRERFGDQYPTWLADPAGFRVPGCETIADVQTRAVAAMEELFASAPVLVVSHLIVARALALHYRGQAIADFRGVEIANGALTTFERLDATTRVTLAG